MRQKILPADHQLDMVVAETFGEEEESILQTAKLWKLNVSAYIGPQESCVHEARMAAAFRLPMISYVSTLMRRCCCCWGVARAIFISCAPRCKSDNVLLMNAPTVAPPSLLEADDRQPIIPAPNGALNADLPITAMNVQYRAIESLY